MYILIVALARYYGRIAKNSTDNRLLQHSKTFVCKDDIQEKVELASIAKMKLISPTFLMSDFSLIVYKFLIIEVWVKCRM